MYNVHNDIVFSCNKTPERTILFSQGEIFSSTVKLEINFLLKPQIYFTVFDRLISALDNCETYSYHCGCFQLFNFCYLLNMLHLDPEPDTTPHLLLEQYLNPLNVETSQYLYHHHF